MKMSVSYDDDGNDPTPHKKNISLNNDLSLENLSFIAKITHINQSA